MEGQIDVSERAKKEGIGLPVVISASLAKQLQPNDYLASLGISFDQRVTNLLELLRANQKTNEQGVLDEADYSIPLMVVRGPLVSEDILNVVVWTREGSDGKKTIVLSCVTEGDDW